MKISFLTPEYPHPKCNHSAGIGTSIYNLGNALISLGHEVRVLLYGQDQDEVFLDDQITVQKIKNIKVKGISRWLTQKKIEKIINKLYVVNKIDLVESIDWGGITSYIQPKQCPVIIKLHGSDTYFCKLEGRHLKKKNFYHEKRALEKADGHLAVSDFVAQKTNEYFGLDLNFKTVYNGVVLNKFIPKSASEQENQILYVGTLIRKKGVLDLASIFNELTKLNPEAHLTLIGSDASDMKTGSASTWELMQEIFSKEALPKVNYQGKVAYEEVNTYIAKASVCVFPSYAEAFPVSWLEAMAMKKAIVASNIGWAQEVIENKKEGFLINPTRHIKYAEKIQNLLINKDIRNSLKESAAQKIKLRFSSKVVANQNLKFYQKVINESK
jgi:glycosyltransferase involved in cell wall biosynthesis